MENNSIVRKYSNVVINGLIVLVFVWIGFKIHGDFDKKIKKIQRQITEEKDKNALIKDLRIKDKKFEAYRAMLKNKDVNRLVNEIGQLAKDSGVQISSIRPMERLTKELYVVYPYDIEVEAPSYHELGKFTGKLENHKAVFIIETSNISKLDANSQKKSENKKNTIGMNIKISTLLLKD